MAVIASLPTHLSSIKDVNESSIWGPPGMGKSCSQVLGDKKMGVRLHRTLFFNKESLFSSQDKVYGTHQEK